MVAEYACGTGDPAYLAEGRAMLITLKKSFEKLGHDVICPQGLKDFSALIEKSSKKSDCGLVIAPDELLYEYTKILEENTINLGSPLESVKLCVDKLSTSAKLDENGIPTPKIFEFDPAQTTKYVIKPRFGCASENIVITSKFLAKDGFITTEFLQGDHISVSLVIGNNELPLTINKQILDISNDVKYRGGIIPYETPSDREVIYTAIKSAKILGCKGYVGIDIVLGDVPFVVDVNPRPTTSIIGINKVMQEEIADLILRAKFGDLPEDVDIGSQISFRLERDEIIWIDKKKKEK